MEENEIIFKSTISTSIYDKNLCDKILEIVKNSNIKIDSTIYYTFDIIFNLESYKEVKNLNDFIIDDEQSSNLNEKDKIYKILSQQLSNSHEKLRAFGFDFDNASIIGDNLIDFNKIFFFIKKHNKKEYLKNGNLKTVLTLFSIMPNRPYIIETIRKFLCEFSERDKENQVQKEIEKANHIPNMINILELMRAVANGILLDTKISKNKKAEKITQLENILLNNYNIYNITPLEISGIIDHEKTTSIPKNNIEIDCPHYLIYKQLKNGKWSIKEIKDLNIAENLITKNEYHKNTECIVIIEKLKPVPFILMEKSLNGTCIVEKENAVNKKNLHLCWIK